MTPKATTVGSFCPSCGAVVRPAALYCSSCGAAAGTLAAAPPVPPPFSVGTVGVLVDGGQPGTAPGSAISSAVPRGVPGDGPAFSYPPFGRRVGAFVIDTLPLLLVAVLLWVFWPAAFGALSWLLIGAGVIVAVLAGVLATLGRSPGSAVWGLRVVREQTGAAPGGMGVGRMLLKYLLLVGTFGVAGFSPLWDSGTRDGERRGRAWWDKIVGTVVVNLVRAPAAANQLATIASDIPAWDIPAGSRAATSTEKATAGLAVWADRPAAPSLVPATPRMADPVGSALIGGVTPSLGIVSEAAGAGSAAEPAWSDGVKHPGGLITGVPGRPEPEPESVPEPGVGASPAPSVDEAIDHTRIATPAPEAEPAWQLTFDDGRTLPLDGPLIVGRNPSSAPDESRAAVLALVDEDRSVSKTHLRIDVRDNTVFVTDRHSTNGVSVRTGTTTSHCAPGVPTPVPDGSTVKFGDREFVVVRR